MADTELREALESAFEAPSTPEPSPAASDVAAPEDASPASEVPASFAAETPSTDGSKARDEKGRFAPKGMAASGKPAAETSAAKPAGAEAAPRSSAPAAVGSPPSSTPAPGPEAARPELRAPQSWTPAAREEWAKLPPTIQAEVARRERETAVALQQGAEHRKLSESFRQAVAPFEGMIRAEGGEPLGAVQSLLQTAAALRTAPPVHKAHLIANMVKTFGVPIEALDAALAGQAPPQGQPAHVDPGQLAAKVREDVLRELHGQRQQAFHERATSQVEEFGASRDYFDVLRPRMGALMEAAAQERHAMTLDEAYELAFQTHPQTKAIWAQREAAKAASNAQASTERAKAAASSVRSQPAGMSGAKAPDDVRGLLEQAWSQHQGR
jgi:hypothetical protein